MAFCEKCGKEIGPDGVCDCQKDQVPPTTQASNAGAASGAGAAPKAAPDFLKNKKVLMAAAAAVAVVLLIIIIGAIAGGGSYKTPVKELVKLINKQSTDLFAYEKLTSPMVGYERKVYNILKKNEDYKDAIDESKEKLKDSYDDIKGFKITKIEFSKAKEMAKKDLRAIQNEAFDSDLYEGMIEMYDDMDDGDYEDLADNLEISKGNAKKLIKETIKAYKSLGKAKVTKGYEVTLRFYGKYEGEKDKTEKIDIHIIKVNGDWYIYEGLGSLLRCSFQDELSDVSLYDIYRTLSRTSFGYGF